MIISPEFPTRSTEGADWRCAAHQLTLSVADLVTYVSGDSATISSADAASSLMSDIEARIRTLAEDLGLRAYSSMRKRNWSSKSETRVTSPLCPTVALHLDIPDASAPVVILAGAGNQSTQTIEARNPQNLARKSIFVKGYDGGLMVQTVLTALISRYLQRAALLRGRAENALNVKEKRSLDEIDEWIDTIAPSAGPYLLHAVDLVKVNIDGAIVSAWLGPVLAASDTSSHQLEAAEISTVLSDLNAAYTLDTAYLNAFSTRLLSGVSPTTFEAPPVLSASSPFALVVPKPRMTWILNPFEVAALRDNPELLTHLAHDVEKFETVGVPLTPYQHYNLAYYYTRAQAVLARVRWEDYAPEVATGQTVSDWSSYMIQAGLWTDAGSAYYLCPVLLFGEWEYTDEGLAATAGGAAAIRAFEARTVTAAYLQTCGVTMSVDRALATIVFRLNSDNTKRAIYVCKSCPSLPVETSIYAACIGARKMANRMAAFAALADGSTRVGVRRVKQVDGAWVLASAEDDENATSTMLITSASGLSALKTTLPSFSFADSILATNYVR